MHLFLKLFSVVRWIQFWPEIDDPKNDIEWLLYWTN